MPHLTFLGASVPAVLEIATRYWLLGIRHLVVIRGDTPRVAPFLRNV